MDDSKEIINEPKSLTKFKRGGAFVVMFLVFALIMGVAGGFITLILLSTNQNIKNKLGINDININSTKTEKMVLEESSAIIDVTKKVSPSVVSIVFSKDVQSWLGSYQQSGGGTGFIITSDGMILTNKHVISDASAEYTVFTADGKDYKARVLSVDPFEDIAIIKIEATGLPVVDLGDSSTTQVGEWVIAIGNALAEFKNTVTVGVISAKDRKITASSGSSSEQLTGLLQTDAAVNPGNSGGPLINLKGQIIGMNTAVAGDAQNIGFAIPINVAKKDIESVQKTGKIVKPMLGIRYYNISKEFAKANNLSVDHGALVYGGKNYGDLAVIPGGPADKAGIVENDIITSINNEEINENNPITQIMQAYNIGDEVTIKYLHKGEEKTAKIKLEEMK